MTGHERAIHWVAERFEGVGPSYRRDVVLTTSELCRQAGRHRRWLELLSLVGLALRLRSRARTGYRPDAVWRQGLYLGAVLLLTMLATETAAGGVGLDRYGAAAALLASLGCALCARRPAAVVLAAGAAVVEVVWIARGVQAGAFVSCCAVAIGGLIAGSPAPGRHARGLALVAGAIALAGGSSAIAVGTGSAQAATVVAFAWVIPIALVVMGWFDPRFAAAATTLVFARLAASGFGELGKALAALEQDGQRGLLARWVLMGAGVLAAWFTTNRSIRRMTRL